MRTKLARYMTNLEHFATAVEFGNISAAAAVLAITQPALTRSIMRLEEALGTQLLHRTPRGVHPTDSGRALLEHIGAVEAELNRAETTIQTIKGLNDGRIHCGAGSVSMNHILPTAVSNVLKRQSRIHINLVEGRTQDLLFKLKSGELDLVIGIEQPDELFPELESEELFQEHFSFYARGNLNAPSAAHMQLKDVVRHERLVLPVLTGSPIKKALDAELERLGGSLNEHIVETLSFAVMRHLVLADEYIAFCSSIPFDAEIRAGSIYALEGDWSFPPFTTRLFRRRSTVTQPLLERFIEEVKRAVAACLRRPENALAAAPRFA